MAIFSKPSLEERLNALISLPKYNPYREMFDAHGEASLNSKEYPRDDVGIRQAGKLRALVVVRALMAESMDELNPAQKAFINFLVDTKKDYSGNFTAEDLEQFLSDNYQLLPSEKKFGTSETRKILESFAESKSVSTWSQRIICQVQADELHKLPKPSSDIQI